MTETILQGKPGWANLPVSVLTFELEIHDSFQLPAFSGSLFRGVLGWALKEVCPLEVYNYLFETTSQVSGQQDAFRPFILLPPLQSRQLQRSQRFTLTLKLLGNGCQHLAFFIQAMQRAGQLGLGSQQVTFEIVRILANEGPNDWIAYDRSAGWSEAYFPLPTALGVFAPPLEQTVTEIELEFCTPTHLVHRGQAIHQPDFHIVLRSLYRRLDGILHHHGCDSLDVNFREDINLALHSVSSQHQTNWYDWERTSYRQARRHSMGGILGYSRYRGQFKPQWIKLLSAGQVAHLGKATTFGMGAYNLRIADE